MWSQKLPKKSLANINEFTVMCWIFVCSFIVRGNTSKVISNIGNKFWPILVWTVLCGRLPIHVHVQYTRILEFKTASCQDQWSSFGCAHILKRYSTPGCFLSLGWCYMSCILKAVLGQCSTRLAVIIMAFRETILQSLYDYVIALLHFNRLYLVIILCGYQVVVAVNCQTNKQMQWHKTYSCTADMDECTHSYAPGYYCSTLVRNLVWPVVVLVRGCIIMHRKNPVVWIIKLLLRCLSNTELHITLYVLCCIDYSRQLHILYIYIHVYYHNYIYG